MKVTLHAFGVKTQWENLAVDEDSFDVVDYCWDFAQYFNNHSQICVFDVSDGEQDAPLIAVYWTNDRRLERF